MSAVTDRSTRRELRRAMGESAIGVLNSHADSIADILRGLEQFNARLTKGEDAREALAVEVDGRLVDLELTVGRTLSGRLRWLLTGR